MVAIEVTAVNATTLPSDGRARQKARTTESHTVRIGAPVRASTLSNQRGRPASRAKANTIRELLVTEKVPHKVTQRMMKLNAIDPPVLPNALVKMWRTGWLESRVAW